jgi:hypothetical protein
MHFDSKKSFFIFTQKSILTAFMYRLKFVVFILFVFSQVFSQSENLFEELDKTIKNEWYHVQQKELILDSLKKEVHLHHSKSQEWDRYVLYRQIASAYTVYVFDSAMTYYRKAIDLAYHIKHPQAIAETQSAFGHLLVSVGYYREAIDSLNKVEVSVLNETQLQEYFSNKVRAYYDLADYINDDFYSPHYRNIAHAYVDSVLKYEVQGTIRPVMTKALRYLVRWNPDSSARAYTYALNHLQPTLHQQAMIHSCLGYIDLEQGNVQSGEAHLIESAIADIKTVTKEATSLMTLARYLFQQGDVQRAYKYILLAKEDAAFFGSKQRLLQVSDIFPAIEGAKLLQEEQKKDKAIRYVWIVSLLTMVIILFLIIVYRQLFNLRKIWLVINKNNKELTHLNEQLQEANKIKEKYIGHFFNTSSMYIQKLETLSDALNKLLASNNPQQLKTVLKDIKPKKERDQLFHNFDEVFLSLFPEFIKCVEAFLNDENKYTLKPGQLLNTELRILALIRLGISDNETMAQVLGVSINTIYTYKTKAKNKSKWSTEVFFTKLNEIKSV